MAEKALELTCRWLHAHKMAPREKIAAASLYAGISPRSPEGRTEFDDDDFPVWDWAGKLVSKEEAVLAVVEWLFGESGDACGDGPSAVIEEVLRDMSSGRRRIEIRTEPVPKFSFSSLDEFVPRAEASGKSGNAEPPLRCCK